MDLKEQKHQTLHNKGARARTRIDNEKNTEYNFISYIKLKSLRLDKRLYIPNILERSVIMYVLEKSE